MPVTAKLSRKFINDLNWSRFEARLEQRIAELRTDLAHLETKLIRWMFLFWVGTLGTLIALLKL